MRTIRIPRDVWWFASGDWGSNAPGCIHWWFDVSDGHWHIGLELKFQRETVESVARKFHALTKAEGLTRKCAAFVLDPACWTDGSDGIAHQFQRYKLPIMKGINDRKNGWQRIHELFRPAPDGLPWLTIDAYRCPYLARTIPQQMSAENDPDDINTRGDDHGVDSLRMGAMSGFVMRRSAGARKAPPKPGSYAYLKQQGQRVVHGVLARR